MLRTALLAILVFSGCAAAQTSEDAAPNLIVNPSMEADADQNGWPDGWHTSADVEYKLPNSLGMTPYTIHLSEGARRGTYCLHYKSVIVPRQHPTPSQWWSVRAWQEARRQRVRTWAIPVITSRFEVQGETEYLLSMWIKAKGARRLHLKYVGHYASDPEERTHWTQPLLKSPRAEELMDGSWDWAEFKTRLFVPGGQDWARLEVWLWQDGQPCELWVDDVSARQVGKAGDAK